MNLPQEFKLRMQKILGNEYNDFIDSFKKQRNYGLRINTLKISIDEFLKMFPFKLEQIPWIKEGFYYDGNNPLTKHPYYKAGLFYIQEPSAMAPGEMVRVNPKEKVLDLCASPGGKTTQIASNLSDEGLLVANDINSNRLKSLIKNIEAYGIKNVVVTNETPERLANKFENFFDKIIVDAPCSGEGTFKKDENALKNFDVFSVDKYHNIQIKILQEASKMLKPEGVILYSTCTFSPQENECVIDEFLSKNNNFRILEIPKKYNISPGIKEHVNNSELEKCARFWPHKLKGEGHFLALLKKFDGEFSKFNIDNKSSKQDLKMFFDFCKENLNISIKENLRVYGKYLYLMPDELPFLEGIKVVRPGCFLGAIRNKRFEPSHALAMILKPEQVKKVVNMYSDSDVVINYLKGQTIFEDSAKGWNLVSVDGFSLGWAKGMEGFLKNYYPPGWRLMK